eukprot:scaffold102131_cov73-Phaeocystis_antarctica.AAC.3
MRLAAAHTSAAQPQQPRPSSGHAPIGRPQELTDLPVQRRGHGGLLPHTEDHRHGQPRCKALLTLPQTLPLPYPSTLTLTLALTQP